MKAYKKETKMKIDYSRKIKGKMIRSCFKDFDGDVRKWQEAYFELLAWKNSYGIPYSLDINCYRGGSPFVQIVMKEVKAVENLVTAMNELGYKNVVVDDVNIELFSPEIDENLPIEDEVHFYFVE